MFDNLKIQSKALNATFKITIYLPDDYDKTDNLYNALYIVSSSNLFLNNNFNLEEHLKEHSLIGICIYPNLEIKKNNLLFNTFNDKYGFNELYQEFIINEVKPHLEKQYRINKDSSTNYILGYKDTAILAYSLTYHYTNNFSKMFLYDLNIDSFYKPFLTDLISRFDPNISIYYNITNNEHKDEITNRLKLFGCVNFRYAKDINELLNNL